MVKAAGFERVRAGCMLDVFSGSPHESSASAFGTRGLAFSARKPAGGEPAGA